MDSTSWRGKRVLVTGADGFVGSHLSEALIGLGARVSILVRGTSVSGTSLHTFKNLPQAAVEKLENIICCDIASADTIELIVKADPQIILHLAAAAYVPYSFDHPLEVLSVNAIGTVYALEAARRLKSLERIVCTSSSEVYGTALTERIDESHPLNPTSPYAASKVAADRYCYSYGSTYGLPVAVIRPFNTYGPRHTYDVIPKFIQLALRNEPITIYGSGEQSRDFLYVTDTVNAFLTMGSHALAAGQVVNFGTGQDVSVNTVASLIKEISGTKSQIVRVERRAAEVDRLCCDYGFARKLFGWEPKVNLEEGLQAHIAWAREHWS
jgi:NDP-hexose 4,6-dehydratase